MKCACGFRLYKIYLLWFFYSYDGKKNCHFPVFLSHSIHELVILREYHLNSWEPLNKTQAQIQKMNENSMKDFLKFELDYYKETICSK